MKIIVLRKGQFEALPQIMSLAIVMKELGHEVEVVASNSERITQDRFAEKGIKIFNLCSRQNCDPSTIVGKIKHWRSFSQGAWKHINNEAENTMLWVSTADTALALGRGLLRKHYILHLRELYDRQHRYRVALAKYARQANCVVVPELSRACIIKYWYDLEKTPIVIPNKYLDHPHDVRIAIEDDCARGLMEQIDVNEKIVLYQGGIHAGRDLSDLAKGVQQMGDGWRFVVMGQARPDYLKVLQKCNPRLVHIPKVPAPLHLQVTSHAYIGIITYSLVCLNNIFCAPNKIWEYAGFGLPMLCNNLPPLQMTVQAHNAGLCIDTEDCSQIVSALEEIENNYESFSQKSRKLYDSVDMHDIVRTVLNRASECSVSK